RRSHGTRHAIPTRRSSDLTPLLLAAEQGHSEAVEALVRGGANVLATDTAGNTALMLAAGAGRADALRMLLAAGADPNAREEVRGLTALMFAAAKDRVDAIEVLVSAGADLSVTTRVVDLASLSPARSPRGGAAGTPDRPLVPGADRPYLYNELVGTMGGFTALHFAAREGHRAAADALLDAG